MAEQQTGLKEQVQAAQTKLLEQLQAAGETYAEFALIGLKSVLNDPMFKEALGNMGLEVKIVETRAAARRTGPKPGRKPGRRASAKTSKATAPEEDKKALLEAMNAIGGTMRSGDAFTKAGLKKPQGKKAMAALKADGAVKAKGPWVSVA